MKLLELIRRWGGMRDHDMAPLFSHAKNVQDKRLAVYEMVAAGAADEPALFIIEEIERLSESITQEL